MWTSMSTCSMIQYVLLFQTFQDMALGTHSCINIGFVLLTLFAISYGKTKFSPMNNLLEGSVLIRCSTVACRSKIEGATRCADDPSCLGIGDAQSVERPCMSCSCPADAINFNAGGIQQTVYKRNVAVFRKSGYKYTYKHGCKWNKNRSSSLF